MTRIFMLLTLIVLVMACVRQPVVQPATATAGQESATIEKTIAEQDRETIEKTMCEQTACRRNVRIRLQQEDGSYFDKTFKIFPGIVQPMGVTIVAGETVYLEADVAGDTLANIRAVDDIRNPNKTIVAHFEQADHGGMMLSLQNPFDRPLKFRMAIMPLDREDLYKTSSCPVMAGGGSFESWPYPIFQVLLMEPRFLMSTGQMACEF